MACIFKPGGVACDHRDARGLAGEDEKMRRRLRAFDKRNLSRQRVVAHLDPAGGRVAVERAERHRDHRLALMQVFEQRARGIRLLRLPARDWRPPRRAAAPGRRRAPAPRTPAGFRAVRPPRYRRRARRGPGRPARATMPQWPRRCPIAPRRGRPASDGSENRARNRAAGRVRSPTGRCFMRV